MRRIFFFITNILLAGTLSAQINIFVDNTYKHQIRGDSLTGEKTIVNQKTFDVKGTKLLFEINYDPVTTLETGIIAYFYDSIGRMISKEIQTVDRMPVKLYRITYNENNDTSEIAVFTPKEDTVALSGIRQYFYDDLNRLTNVKCVDPRGNLSGEKIIKYGKNKSYPASSKIISYVPAKCTQKNVYDFIDSTRLIRKIKITDGCNQTGFKKYGIKYDYNPKNKITSEIKLEKNGKVISKRIYTYTNDIDLSTFYDIDENNKITAFYSRTFFWHKVSYINVKSYFE